jgi:endoglucanase
MTIRRVFLSFVALIVAGSGVAFALRGINESLRDRRPALIGVNLPSATFAERTLPGKEGVDYFYPDAPDMDYFVRNGMNVVRIGFLWERLQPVLNGPLDAREAQGLDSAVKAALRRRATVILDLHNYARYRGQVIGSEAVPDESLADFWARLAAIYGGNDEIIFGLMNEPHDIDAEQWRRAAQSAILRIRQAGARNLILVSSSRWDGASHFTADGEIWKQIADPGDNFAFEVHQYVDVDNTGTHRDCPDTRVGLAAIQAVTRWMQENRRKALLSEFGASDRTDCLAALALMLSFIQQHSDTWLGWTYFAGGRGWADDDVLSIQPVANKDKPQMELLRQYLR